MQPPASSLQISKNLNLAQLDERQIAGLWMLGAALVLLLGAITPYFATISETTMGFSKEIHVGFFGAERCAAGRCETLSLSSLNAGNKTASLILFAWRTLLATAICANIAAGVTAFTGRKTAGTWVRSSNGILFVFLCLSLLFFVAMMFEGNENGRSVSPGFSLFLLIAGAFTAMRIQIQKIDASSNATAGVSTGPHVAPLVPAAPPMMFGPVSLPYPSAAPQAAQPSTVPVRTGGTMLAPSSQDVPRCPSCGNNTQWLPQDGRWFCRHDQRYV